MCFHYRLHMVIKFIKTSRRKLQPQTTTYLFLKELILLLPMSFKFVDEHEQLNV